MTGKELLDKLLTTLLIIGPTSKTIDFYQETKESLSDFHLIDSFTQLKKNDGGDGLALEILMFDSDILHDIVFTKTTMDHISLVTKSINTLFIQSSLGESTDETGEATFVDDLTLNISIGGDLRALAYKTDTKKFTELQRVKTNLLKSIRR